MGRTCTRSSRKFLLLTSCLFSLSFLATPALSPCFAQGAAPVDCKALGKACLKETKLLRKLKKRLVKQQVKLTKLQTKTQAKVEAIDGKIAALQTAIETASGDQLKQLRSKLEGLTSKRGKVLRKAETKAAKINTAISAIEALIAAQRAKREEVCLSRALYCEMPANVLDNASFRDKANWGVWSHPWASEQNSRSFEVDPSGQMAIVRTALLGNRSIYQHFDNVFLETDAISVSVDINVQKIIRAQEGGSVGAVLYSYWDSSDDIDYCAAPSGGPDYSRICTTNSECPGSSCMKFSWFFCKDPAGNWTNDPCFEGRFLNTHCEARFGPGSICTDVGSVQDVNAPRDFVMTHTLNADLNLKNQWQNLSRWITLGTQGAGRALLSCDLFLTVRDGAIQDGSSSNPMLNRPSSSQHTVGQICNTSDQWDLGCQKTVCRLPGADGIFDTADDSDGSTQCTYATASETGAATNGVCPNGQQCGGESEAWFKNPVLTMLRLAPE